MAQQTAPGADTPNFSGSFSAAFTTALAFS
jgi:hypothetical protein